MRKNKNQYYHVTNKNELLFAISGVIIDEKVQRLEHVIGCFPDPMERMRQMICFQISLLGNRKTEVKIFCRGYG